MSGFYITLPSNSSMNIYPNNKQSSYTTKLRENINFTSPHEVALVEINYAPTIKTDIGAIEIRDYFKNIYEVKNNTIEIPISIMKQTSIEKLLILLNRKLDQTIFIDEIIYRSTSIYLKTFDTILDKHWFCNKIKKDQNDYTLEVFKCIDKESKYVIIDREDSVFSEDFLKINKNSFDTILNKWHFDSKEILELNKIFNLTIFLCLVRLEKLKNYKFDDDKFKNMITDKVEQYIFDNSKEKFNILDDLKLKGNLPKNSSVILLKKNSELTFSSDDTVDFLKRHKLPELELTHNDENRVVVKLNHENEDEFSFLYILRGKLANYFFGAEIGSFIINNFYYVDNFMSTINYAILYTDIIENQYFGDTKSPILKIIPIKTQTDNEVVTFFDNLHYVPVKNNYISSINIEIKDIHGNNIKFENNFSFVVIKLHIRKIRNE